MGGNILMRDLPAVSDKSEDALTEAVFARIAQGDCVKFGWVLTNFPTTITQAKSLQASRFSPIRVVTLDVPEAACTRRLGTQMTDPVTGKTWTAPPTSDVVRKRLKRNATDEPDHVRGLYQKFAANIQGIYSVLVEGGIGVQINADQRDEREVSDEIAEFVERPLAIE